MTERRVRSALSNDLLSEEEKEMFRELFNGKDGARKK